MIKRAGLSSWIALFLFCFGFLLFLLFWFWINFFPLSLDAYLSPDIRYEGDVIVPAVDFGLFSVAGLGGVLVEP